MREPVEWEAAEGVLVRSTPLPYERAEDSLPEVFSIVAAVVEQGRSALAGLEGGLETILSMDSQKDFAKLAPIIAPIVSTLTDRLGNGRLKDLAPKLLWSTSVVMPNAEGGREIKNLSQIIDRREVFDSYPHLYFPILFFAGRTTYARFFPAAARNVSEKSKKVTS